MDFIDNILFDLCRGDKNLCENKAIRILVNNRLGYSSDLLSMEQKNLLLAKYDEKCSVEQIAKYLSINVCLVNNKINKALDIIRTNGKSYKNMLDDHIKELESQSCIKYAFSEKQFEQILSEWHLDFENHKECVYQITEHPGMYGLTISADIINDILEKHTAQKLLAYKCDKFLYEAFCYEISARHYFIKGDIDNTFSCLGITDRYIKNEVNGEYRIKGTLIDAKNNCSFSKIKYTY